MLTPTVVNRFVDALDCSPWGASAGRRGRGAGQARRPALYTPEERRRRDASPWTLVQGVLAPFQFAVFLLSLALVLRCLATGEGFGIATVSVVAKTLVLYTIMVTGSIWEKEVFGRWLFAPAFFWEDVVSGVVIAVHTLYLAGLAGGFLGPRALMYVAGIPLTAMMIKNRTTSVSGNPIVSRYAGISS